jgi:hypothetical protein
MNFPGEEIRELEVKLYPNPSQGPTNISVNDTDLVDNIKVVNGFGSIVSEYSFERHNLVEVQVNEPGVYYVFFEYQGKVIKKARFVRL